MDGEECREKYEASKEYYIRKHVYKGIYTGQQLMREMVQNNEYRVSPCLQLIDRKYFADVKLKFLEGIIQEDNLFNYQCMLKAKRVGYVNEQLFYRRYRPGSTMTRKVTFAHVYGYFRCYLEMQMFYERLSIDETYINSALKILYSMLQSARNRYYELSEEEQYSVLGLPQYEQMMFSAYIVDIYQMRKQRDRIRSEKENVNRRLQNEVKARKRAENTAEKLEIRIKGLETSETFRVGKVIMWLPRKIKSVLEIIIEKERRYK